MNFSHSQFDLIIALGIIMTALPAMILFLVARKSKNQKKLLHLMASFFLIGTITLVWGSFIEPKIIIVKKEKIDLEYIEKPVIIALVADYQVGPYKKDQFVERTVRKILKSDPDLVLIAGDQIDNNLYDQQTDETKYLKPLEELAKKIPVYAVHGNHEYGIWGPGSINDKSARYPDNSQKTKKAMEELGVRYLVNELEEIQVQDQEFFLYGSDAWWSGNTDFSVLENLQKETAVIGLVHNPAATWEASKHGIDLMLAGHTHGGQIRLPFLGPIGKVDGVIPDKWYKGWYEHDSLKVFVTSGVGESGARARLFNLPEIVLLEVY